MSKKKNIAVPKALMRPVFVVTQSLQRRHETQSEHVWSVYSLWSKTLSIQVDHEEQIFPMIHNSYSLISSPQLSNVKVLTNPLVVFKFLVLYVMYNKFYFVTNFIEKPLGIFISFNMFTENIISIQALPSLGPRRAPRKIRMDVSTIPQRSTQFYQRNYSRTEKLPDIQHKLRKEIC